MKEKTDLQIDYFQGFLAHTLTNLKTVLIKLEFPYKSQIYDSNYKLKLTKKKYFNFKLKLTESTKYALPKSFLTFKTTTTKDFFISKNLPNTSSSSAQKRNFLCCRMLTMLHLTYWSKWPSQCSIILKAFSLTSEEKHYWTITLTVNTLDWMNIWSEFLFGKL
jgi:hypothetical protein